MRQHLNGSNITEETGIYLSIYVVFCNSYIALSGSQCDVNGKILHNFGADSNGCYTHLWWQWQLTEQIGIKATIAGVHIAAATKYRGVKNFPWVAH